MQLTSECITYRSPGLGTVAYEKTYYTRRTGLEKMRLCSLEIASDIHDAGRRSFSSDNGRTWSEEQDYAMGDKTAKGTVRRWEATGFVDPVNGHLLTLSYEGLLANDENLEGMQTYYINYRVSADGGRSALAEGQLVQDGYTPDHPFPCIYLGKNALLTGGESPIVRAPQGHLVVGTNFTPLDDDGVYRPPAGCHNFLQILILFGDWQPDGSIRWRQGPRIDLDSARSTRGASEPTLALLPDGRILLVFRGGNDGRPELPGRKWYCVSNDGGLSWSEPDAWHYADGSSFYSPGSVSQLLSHSNGKLYWLGNISPQNPSGNYHRYPLVIGEVDTESLFLIKDTVYQIDTLRPGDHESLALSNFSAHEDRENGDIVLHCTRMFSPGPSEATWYGDAYTYRLEPNTDIKNSGPNA